MRYYTIIPTFIVAFIMQLTMMNLFSINGIAPNLLLCLVLVITFLFDGERRCIVCGVIAGLFLDIVVGKFLGVFALTFFIIGMLTVFYKHYFNYESKISIVPLAFAGTAIYHILSSIILGILGVKISIVKIITFTLISSVLNLILMYIIYVLLIKKATSRSGRTRYERYETI